MIHHPPTLLYDCILISKAHCRARGIQNILKQKTVSRSLSLFSAPLSVPALFSLHLCRCHYCLHPCRCHYDHCTPVCATIYCTCNCIIAHLTVPLQSLHRPLFVPLYNCIIAHLTVPLQSLHPCWCYNTTHL